MPAEPGDFYVCSDGTFFLKTQGSGQTGWTQVVISGGGGGGAAAMTRHVPTGAIDGVNASFVFYPAPSNADAFFLDWNGLIVDPADYSLAGATVTTTGFTPKVGDKLYGLF